MIRLSAVLLVSLLLSGCGYAICRAFGNNNQQCAYDCTWNYVLDADGKRVKEPWFPYDEKVEPTCTYSLGKVLLP